MNVYTYSEARQNLASVLDTAKKSGKAFIKRRDGSIFRLEPAKRSKSPFEKVKGISSNITTEDMLSYIRESREA